MRSRRRGVDRLRRKQDVIQLGLEQRGDRHGHHLLDHQLRDARRGTSTGTIGSSAGATTSSASSTTTNTSASSTGTSTTTSGTSSSTSTTTTTGTTGTSGACAQNAAGANNGNLGSVCTGAATDGGLTPGSCAPSEFCFDLFNDGTDRCYADCDAYTHTCPGSAVCSSGVCFPDCDPAVALCPGGLVCTPSTPGTHEAGICYSACIDDASCNADQADGGAPFTQFACVNGACRCTSDNDCSSDGSLACDTTSGACYAPCTSDASCITGCCATEGSIQYCDGQGAGACAAPSILCGTGCVDSSSDDLHCGGCDTVCTGGQHCYGGQCLASNIQHVVLIVQENHSFDTYFGNYCTATAYSNPTCTTGPACCEAAPVQEASGSAPGALNDSANCGTDHDHEYSCEICQIDDGLMDKYVAGGCPTSGIGTYSCSNAANFETASSSLMSTYWNYADTWALADRYFQPIASATASNDMYLAGAKYQFLDNADEPDAIGRTCLYGGSIFDSSTAVTLSGSTIADLLLDQGHTFGAYADGYAEAVAAAPNCPSGAADCFTVDSCRFVDFACKYDPSDIPFEYFGRFRDNPAYMKDLAADFQGDLSTGNLPDLAYVKWRTYKNEHPGHADISTGEAAVDSIVQMVEASPIYANNTLVLLTWDEGGGFYDHVSPPDSIENFPAGDAHAGQPVPYGTRVPMLAIGPFARTGTVSHVTMEHSSLIRFLEYNFLGPTRTGALGTRDAAVNNIGSMLDTNAAGIPVPESN